MAKKSSPRGVGPSEARLARMGLRLSPSLLHRHLYRTTRRSMAYDGGDVKAWQRRLRARLRELVGWMPAERCDLNVRSIWTRQHRLGTIEKIVFTPEPQADVPAYLCLPRGVDPPYPLMICLQGHSTGMHVSIGVDRDDDRRPHRAEGDRDFALGCLARGVAALCIEQRSLGYRRERAQKHVSPHPCHDAVMHSLMLGRTLLGERVYDVDRALDYLAGRGDVDMRRVGVMGNSGGGTVSVYAAALLGRIRLAAPSCFFCAFGEGVMSIYHCADNYVPGLLRHAECADVMGLFAPRPVVIVAGRTDPIFPIAGVRRAFADLRRIYAAAGAADRCRLVVGPGGHRFYAAQAWPLIGRALRLCAAGR